MAKNPTEYFLLPSSEKMAAKSDKAAAVHVKKDEDIKTLAKAQQFGRSEQKEYLPENLITVGAQLGFDSDFLGPIGKVFFGILYSVGIVYGVLDDTRKEIEEKFPDVFKASPTECEEMSNEKDSHYNDFYLKSFDSIL